MPELLIPLFIFYIIFLTIIMKKPTAPEVKKAPESDTAQPVSIMEAKVKEPATKPKSARASKTAAPKPASVAKTEQPAVVAASAAEPVKSSQPAKSAKKPAAKTTGQTAGTPELTLAQRVGLTAGSIWQFLSEHGATPVTKLVKELPEEEKVIQRSIGWLAQEGKITLETADKVETIALTDNR